LVLSELRPKQGAGMDTWKYVSVVKYHGDVLASVIYSPERMLTWVEESFRAGQVLRLPHGIENLLHLNVISSVI